MRILFALCFCVLTTATADAQGQLENPTTGSSQSGQGIISGWHCQATTIEIVVNGAIRVHAPYGTLRGDTRSACGDVNNGFGFQVNWNELGDGTHSLVVLADGNQFGQATFTVKTLGVPYLTGASGTFQIQGFAGRNLTIQWSEPLQNFVITGASPPSTQNFSGQWFFQANQRQNTCIFATPDVVPFHIETTLGVTQTGTALSVRSGAVTLQGEVDSAGEFAVAGVPQVSTAGTCTFSLLAGYAGNFVTSTAGLIILGERESGDCATLFPCQVAWIGTVTKTSSLSTSQAQNLDALLRTMRDSVQQQLP
jgi:hypothetical protein